MARVENVHLRLRHILTVTFRLAWIEREIVPAPNDQQLRLRLLHPRLPLRIGVHIRAIVVEKIALNLRLSRRIEKCILIRPQVRVIQLDVRIVPDMARLRRRQ